MSKKIILFLVLLAMLLFATYLMLLPTGSRLFKARTGLNWLTSAEVEYNELKELGPFDSDGYRIVCIDANPRELDDWLGSKPFWGKRAWQSSTVSDVRLPITLDLIPLEVDPLKEINYASNGDTTEGEALIICKSLGKAWLVLWW